MSNNRQNQVHQKILEMTRVVVRKHCEKGNFWHGRQKIMRTWNKELVEEILLKGKPKVKVKKACSQLFFIQTLLSVVVIIPPYEQSDNNKKKNKKYTLNEMDGLCPGSYWRVLNRARQLIFFYFIKWTTSTRERYGASRVEVCRIIWDHTICAWVSNRWIPAKWKIEEGKRWGSIGTNSHREGQAQVWLPE